MKLTSAEVAQLREIIFQIENGNGDNLADTDVYLLRRIADMAEADQS